MQLENQRYQSHYDTIVRLLANMLEAMDPDKVRGILCVALEEAEKMGRLPEGE